MLTISEKDGATIIVIEEPTPSEEILIKQANQIQRFSSGSVWSKFKCNQSSDVSDDDSVQEETFEEAISQEIPFEEV